MKKKDKRKNKIILIASSIFGGVLTLWFLAAWITSTIFKSGYSLISSQTLTVWFLLILSVFLLLIFNHKTNLGSWVLKLNKGLEDAHWLTMQEINKNKGLTVTKLSQLHNVADGVPIHAEKNGDDIDIILAKTTHTLTIGSSGSGKTVTVVDPTVQILSRTKTKPSMVITDPKGEIYMHHADSLKKQGYKVLLIDLVEPFRSTRWNPFNDVWLKTDKMLSMNESFQKGKYEFNGKVFKTLEQAENEKKVYMQEMTSEIFDDIQDIIYTICPIENKNDSTWQKGARDLILALALCFWEDVRDGYMTRKQFNLFCLSQNISNYCTADFETFKDYFENRDEFSKTKVFGGTVLVSQDKTLTSYLGDVNSYFAWMADVGISALTSTNDIDFNEFDEKPHALFLKIPDYKENRHRLVTLFITQFYKALVDKAEKNCRDGKTGEATLLRNVYLIMDEFGNMPKFANVENILTVGRSRKIFLMPIIQNYKQLDEKYSKEDGGIIRSECLIKTFIQSSDPETTREFSELCGKHKVKNYSFSEQKEVSVSVRAEQVPLVYPSELQTMNDAAAGVEHMGNAIVMAVGRSPFKAKLTPLFDARDIYKIEDIKNSYREPIPFEESDFYYDIAKRNIFIEELKNVEQDVNDFANSLLAEFEAMPDPALMDEDEYNERLEEYAKVIMKSIDERLIKKLKNKIPKAALEQLLKVDVMSKIELLKAMIDESVENRNHFLNFDLIEVKNHIEKIVDNNPVVGMPS